MTFSELALGIGTATGLEKIIFEKKSETEDKGWEGDQGKIFEPSQPSSIFGFATSGFGRERERVGCELAVMVIAVVHAGLERPNRGN